VTPARADVLTTNGHVVIFEEAVGAAATGVPRRTTQTLFCLRSRSARG